MKRCGRKEAWLPIDRPPTDEEIWRFLEPHLRKIEVRHWPARKAALRAMQCARGHFYWCIKCKKILPKEVVNADHIQPIAGYGEKEDFLGARIRRQFIEMKAYQIVCIRCHSEKTSQEDALRRALKAVPASP